MHQQVGVAADGRGEVQVGRAREPGVPRLERASSTPGGGSAAPASERRPPRPRGQVARDGVGRGHGGGAAGRGAERALGQRGRGDVQLVELLVEQLDAALRRVLVVAEDRGRPRAIRYRATASLAAIMHSSTSECAAVWPSRWIPATRSPAKVTTGSGEEASSAPRASRAFAQPPGHQGRARQVGLESRVAERLPAVERVHLRVGEPPLGADH